MYVGKELSFKVFVISLTLIFLCALAGIGWLYYYLNADEIGTAFKYLPVSQEPSSFNLTINSPEDSTLNQDGSIIISGKTADFASIIVVNGDNTVGFEANSQGDFSKVITLTEGPNILQIHAYDKQGAVKSVTKYVYFTKETLEE